MNRQSLSQIEDEFRRQGLALTVQRRVILGELLGRKDHPTADQIYDSVRDDVPGLSRTTVYRVLDTLVQLGAARKVLHADASVRFDPNTARHHHLVCESCGALIDLDDGALPEINLPKAGSGFKITNYTINFTGVCSGCRQTDRSSQ